MVAGRRWYKHNYGDTELCERAIADGVYAKAPWAILYHNHPYWAGADDEVYAEGRATIEQRSAPLRATKKRAAGNEAFFATNRGERLDGSDRQSRVDRIHYRTPLSLFG